MPTVKEHIEAAYAANFKNADWEETGSAVKARAFDTAIRRILAVPKREKQKDSEIELDP